MKWEKIRARYPHEWLLIEAVEAHSENGKRILDKLVVIDVFADWQKAMQSYKQLHHQGPNRELFVLHTDRETLDIQERKWLGLRGVHLRSGLAFVSGSLVYQGKKLELQHVLIDSGSIGLDFLLQTGAITDWSRLEIRKETRT